jgi:putative inorganic carbon (hco3(-)) transporter
MQGVRPARAPALMWVLPAGGLAYFISAPGQGLGSYRTYVIVTLAAALLLHLIRNVDPAWLISAGIAASMFSGNWEQLGIRTTFVPDRVLIIGAVVAVVFRLGPSRDRPPLELRTVHFALAAALAYALISMVSVDTTGNHSAVFALLDQFGVIPFLVFTIAPTVFRTTHQRAILLGSLVATGAYLSLTALFEKLKLDALIWPDYITSPYVGTHYGRSRGPFAEAVANGLALYACAVAAAMAFVTWRRPLLRARAAATSVLCLVGVQLTVTRAIWLGAIAATTVVLVAAPPLRRFLAPAIAAGLLLVFGAFAAVPGLASQARDRQKDQSPVWERRNSDAAALRMIQAEPLVGFGWYHHDESAEPFFKMSPSFPLSGEKAGMHNVFLTYAVGLGLVGFGIWLAGALLAFGGAVRPRGPPELVPWRIGLGAVVMCYVVSGMAGPLAYVYPTLLAWAWAGVAYGRRVPEPVGDGGVPAYGWLGRDNLQLSPRKAA